MLKYIASVLLRFKHSLAARPQHSPHKWNQPVYGRGPQLVDTPPIAPNSSCWYSPRPKVVGSLLYYALAVDCTLLVTLGDLAAVQTNVTEETLNKIMWLLNYCVTHPNAEITYVASDMCLHAHSDVSYLSVPKARSRAEGHFFSVKNQLLANHQLNATPMEPFTWYPK